MKDPDVQILDLADAAPEWYPEDETPVVLPPCHTLLQLPDVRTEGDPNELIRHRFACRGTVGMLNAPSGIGKSTFIEQGAISFALARQFFGLEPTAPLKSDILQAENDPGDLGQMFRGVVAGLDLTDEDLLAVDERVKIYTESSRRVTASAGAECHR